MYTFFTIVFSSVLLIIKYSIKSGKIKKYALKITKLHANYKHCKLLIYIF